MNKEIGTQRKQWQTPELTVLMRGKPEEAVLETCKVALIAQTASFPSGVAISCSTPKQACSNACSSLVGS
jgi:hypothetical protein